MSDHSLPQRGDSLLVMFQEASKDLMGKKSVLIVEDDEGLMEALQELLEMEGYTVLRARDGLEALEILETIIPSVVLLDLRMPRMDGEAFARAAHERMRLRSLYIIVMTANLYARQTAFAVGANDFLAKPFDISTLLEKLNQAIS